MSDLADAARKLLTEQSQNWDILRANRAALARSPLRTFDFGKFAVKAQLNLTRISSVSASVQPDVIRNRPCFLCDANRPPQQESLEWKSGYKILCNPSPILPEHFTIIQTEHRPQRILPAIGPLIELAREMSGGFTVFYNGPQCGASAPDHLHFQAGTAGYLPIDHDYDRLKRLLGQKYSVNMFTAENYLRRFISFESMDAAALERVFSELHHVMWQLQPNATEPMMNVMCNYSAGIWRLVAFLRSRHRPSAFFAAEPHRLMISPGSVDIGGVIVMPRRQDFESITIDQIKQVYEEVSLPDQEFAALAPFPASRISP